MFRSGRSFFHLFALLASSLLAFLPMLSIEHVREAAEKNAHSSWPSAHSSTEIIVLDPFQVLIALAGLTLFVLLLIVLLNFRHPERQLKLGRISVIIYAAAIVVVVLASFVPLSFVFLEVDGRRLMNGFSVLPLTFWFCIFAPGILFVLSGNRGAKQGRDRRVP